MTIKPKLLTAIAVAAMLAGPVMAQRRYGRGGGGGTGPSANPLPSDTVQSAVVNFNGVLRNFDKKKILVDDEEGQTLTFRRTKTTTLIPAGTHSALELGFKVQVEAHRDKVGDLDAVRVCENKCPAN